MAKELKVYGWVGRRNEARELEGNRTHGQTREIMAAHSIAEVLRATGMSRRDWEHSGCETGNSREIALAMAHPGEVFWSGLNYSDGNPWFNDAGEQVDQ